MTLYVMDSVATEMRILGRIMQETMGGLRRTGWMNAVIVITMASILSIFGTLFGDTITGSSGANILIGDGGFRGLVIRNESAGIEFLEASRVRAASGVMRDILVKVVNESYEGQLGRITGPVHLIWGADDADVPVSVAETAQPLIRDVTLEVLPGVGHFVPIQAPQALREAIEKALA